MSRIAQSHDDNYQEGDPPTKPSETGSSSSLDLEKRILTSRASGDTQDYHHA